MTSMRKRKNEPLTMHEVYLLRVMRKENVPGGWNLVKHAWVQEPGTPRSVANARRFIASRRNNPKYAGCVETLKEFHEALDSGVPQRIIDAVYHMNYALKYQGYLQMELILAEERIKGMSEQEVAAMMVGDAL